MWLYISNISLIIYESFTSLIIHAVLLINFKKMNIFLWSALSFFLINEFCWNFMKFINEEVKPNLRESTSTLCLNFHLDIKHVHGLFLP